VLNHDLDSIDFDWRIAIFELQEELQEEQRTYGGQRGEHYLQ
jgi:hypothetical protein